MLEVKNLSFKFAEHCDELFQHIHLSIFPGQLTLLKGDSGIGKSTLCKIMCGVVPNVVKGEIQGSVTFQSKSIPAMSLLEVSRYIGVVFQDPDTQLFMPTVEDEIAFGLENLAINPYTITKKIEKVIRNNELESVIHKNPKLCSGGEKQLIVFSSVVVMNHPILLLDEAFSQVDSRKCELIREQLFNLKRQGKGIFLIDHQDNYDDIADHIYCLETRKLMKIG